MNNNPFYAVDPSRAPLNPNWINALDEAIRANDEHAIWGVMAQSPDPEDAHDKLATLVARMAYRYGSKNTYSELFLIPIIGSQELMLDATTWREASYAIGEAVDIWKPKNTTKSIFNGLRVYDWVGTWNPEVIRKHLLKTVPGQTSNELRVVTEVVEIPARAPKLGFVLFVLSGTAGWPRLDKITPQQDERIKSIISFSLQTMPDQSPVVLPPERTQFAIPDGLCMWLKLLHEQVGIKGWAVAPIVVTPDVIKVTLALDDNEVPYTQFTLRKHQMGLRGLNSILLMLEQLAPNMEVPMDLKQLKKRMQIHDLT